MANRRMISKSISVSDQTNALGNFAALLFTWLIPHADDYGVIPGAPGRIKALVVPRRPETEADVDAALSDMQDVGLIHRYENQGQQYVQLVNFEQHQEGLHRRTVARHPVFNSEGSTTLSRKFREVPGNSRLTEPNLNERNLTEQNPREGNRTTTEPNLGTPPVDKWRLDSEDLVTSSASAKKNVAAGSTKIRDAVDEGTGNAAAVVVVCNLLAENVCPVKNRIGTDLVRHWLDTYPRVWIDKAICEAALSKATSIKYVDSILQAWHGKYQPHEQPWQLDRQNRQRASPVGKSFAMAKLERMARAALAEESRTKGDGSPDTH